MRHDHYHHVAPELAELLSELVVALRGASAGDGKILAAIEEMKGTLMAKMDDEAAAIAANTAAIKAISAQVTTISDGHATISDEIDALKAAASAGQTPDFTALDAAMADQTAAIATLTSQVPVAPTAPAAT